jgi:outer membrane protein assembly factor BamB
VLTVNGRALVNRNGTGFSSPLDCVDIATQKLAWEATDGKFIGTPAVANNIIYTINENRFRLEARSLDDGHLLWHWSPQAVDGSIIYGNVLVTDNLVFFSTNTHVYAVDIEKRTGVWSYPRSGELTISASGLLYIAFGGKVTAINLQ